MSGMNLKDKVKVVEVIYLGWCCRQGHEGEVLALLGEVIVGDGEAQHLGQVGQLLLGRHALA